MTTDIPALLEERGQRYGEAELTAARYIALKRLVYNVREDEFSPITRYCFDMLLVKLSRLFNSPEDADTWTDIAGYAQLWLQHQEKPVGEL